MVVDESTATQESEQLTQVLSRVQQQLHKEKERVGKVKEQVERLRKSSQDNSSVKQQQLSGDDVSTDEEYLPQKKTK
jgi:hypothetical protein